MSGFPQRTLLWTCEAAGVTAGLDGTVHGRMYSGLVRSCTCLTMQVPEACRLSGLAALKERSPSIEHLTFDIQSLAISKVDTKVEDTPIRMVIMGEAYLQRETSDKPNRFVCLVSDKGKVVLTFFTEQ